MDFIQCRRIESAEEIGRGSEYLFTRLLGAETPRETIKDLVICFKEIYGRHLLDHTQIYPGVMNALSHYSAFPKVIVTNKNQIFSDQIVDATGLRKHFDGVFGSEAFTTQKPDPGPILAVCKQWNKVPSEAVVIGDSEFDIVAGKKAGARTVGVLYGIGHPEAFRAHPPDFQIESADQLIGLFPIEEDSGAPLSGRLHA